MPKFLKRIVHFWPGWGTACENLYPNNVPENKTKVRPWHTSTENWGYVTCKKCLAWKAGIPQK